MSNEIFDNEAGSAPLASNVAELTVSEISGQLKRLIEDSFGLVRVRGEVGRVSRPASGHLYLDLKDERAVLSGVIWKGTAGRLRHQPEEGLEVVATGKLTTFPGSSRYQIIIENIEPAGAGALMALLEERKRKLEAEGLFAAERKQLLPFMPKVIGVVTSPSGAVIRDILHRVSDRFPLHVIVWPVRVQGETCGAEVAAAIRGFNAIEHGGAITRPDVIIVARGGGSIEDLWGFNDEAVVRAAADSDIPIVSAVGHETDWTLIDLAADRRAPTPTGAAEMVVPVKADLSAQLAQLAARLQSAIVRSFEARRLSLRSAMRGLPSPDNLFALQSQRLDRHADRLKSTLLGAVQRRQTAWARVAAGLNPALLAARVSSRRDALSYLDRRRQAAISARLQSLSGEAARLRLSRQVLESGLKEAAGRLSATLTALSRHQRQTGEHLQGRLDQAGRLLASYSYHNTLERGFAVVRDPSGAVVTRASQTVGGTAYRLQFADDAIEVERLDGTRRLQTGSRGGPSVGSTSGAGRSAPRGQTSSAGASQGSLFDQD